MIDRTITFPSAKKVLTLVTCASLYTLLPYLSYQSY